VSPDQLLVPILVASIVVAVVLFVMTFLVRGNRQDSLLSERSAEPPEPPDEEPDGWYFIKHEPSGPGADLSLP
jgi:hypothetical protein